MGRIEAAQQAFETIYSDDKWGLKEETGYEQVREGFEPETEKRRRLALLLQDFLKLNAVRSIVDFGCGFWSFFRDVDLTGVRYDGFDVVKGIVDWNNSLYAADNIRFHHVHPGIELPSADLLFTKHVLQHLPLADVQYYLGIFRRQYKFLIIANDVKPDDNTNGDTEPGGYRALRIDQPPFNIPCAVLQRWEDIYFDHHTVTDFCLAFGATGETTAPAVLTDS